MRLRGLALGVLVLAAASAAAEDAAPEAAGPGRFELYTGCAGLAVRAEFVKTKVVGMRNLTRAAVRATAVSRLREAGLYRESSPHQLVAGLGMVGSAMSMWVYFEKRLHDPATGKSGPAVTWRRITGGPNTASTFTTLATLKIHIDAFIADYQEVNKAACEQA